VRWLSATSQQPRSHLYRGRPPNPPMRLGRKTCGLITARPMPQNLRARHRPAHAGPEMPLLSETAGGSP